MKRLKINDKPVRRLKIQEVQHCSKFITVCISFYYCSNSKDICYIYIDLPVSLWSFVNRMLNGECIFTSNKQLDKKYIRIFPYILLFATPNIVVNHRHLFNIIKRPMINYIQSVKQVEKTNSHEIIQVQICSLYLFFSIIKKKRYYRKVDLFIKNI